MQKYTIDTIGEDSNKGESLKGKIISILILRGQTTIPELARWLDVSIPTVTKFINELFEEKLILDLGKVETSSGRRPNIYGLNPNAAYFVGVDVNNTHVEIALMDMKGEIIDIQMNIPYLLENKAEQLNKLCDIISTFLLKNSKYSKSIVNIGINLSGRINPTTGYSHSFFYDEEQSLSSILRERLHYPVSIDNDSRAMTYGEYLCGVVENEKNILFINVGWGLGMGLIIDGKLYYGRSGFSGEFGHYHAFDNEIICHCGKKGCLETEASGSALHRIILEKYRSGSSTVLASIIEDEKGLDLSDILHAASREDILSIEVIEQVGHNLGKNLAGLINIFNPEIVIIGGAVSEAGEYLMGPLLSTIRKYSLNMANRDTSIKRSILGNKAGVMGACMMARSKHFSLIALPESNNSTTGEEVK